MTPPSNKPTFGSRCCIILIRGYQATLGPLMGGHCRFHPTCSAFAADCYRAHGVLRGTWLTAKRLLKCHPLSRHAGFDPVPPSNRSGTTGVSIPKSDTCR
jgi:uncharacterized protein